MQWASGPWVAHQLWILNPPVLLLTECAGNISVHIPWPFSSNWRIWWGGGALDISHATAWIGCSVTIQEEVAVYLWQVMVALVPVDGIALYPYLQTFFTADHFCMWSLSSSLWMIKIWMIKTSVLHRYMVIFADSFTIPIHLIFFSISFQSKMLWNCMKKSTSFEVNSAWKLICQTFLVI